MVSNPSAVQRPAGDDCLRTDNGAVTGRGRFRMKQLATPAGLIFSLDFVNSSGQDSTVNHVLNKTGDTLYISNQAYAGKYWVREYVRQKGNPID
jgi:hypothetical protein